MDSGLELLLARPERDLLRPAPWSPLSLGIRPETPGQKVFQRDLNEAALTRKPPPALTGDDVEAARQEGHTAGYAAGQADAAAAGAAHEHQALATLADVMAQTAKVGASVADEVALALSRALFDALSLTLPDLLRRSGLGETEAFLSLLLPGLTREPEVVVVVPPVLAAGVAAHVRKLGAGQATRITVTGQDGLAPGEVRVSWNGGTAHRAPQEVWRSILDAFEPHLSEAALEQPTHAG